MFSLNENLSLGHCLLGHWFLRVTAAVGERSLVHSVAGPKKAVKYYVLYAFLISGLAGKSTHMQCGTTERSLNTDEMRQFLPKSLSCKINNGRISFSTDQRCSQSVNRRPSRMLLLVKIRRVLRISISKHLLYVIPRATGCRACEAKKESSLTKTKVATSGGSIASAITRLMTVLSRSGRRLDWAGTGCPPSVASTGESLPEWGVLGRRFTLTAESCRRLSAGGDVSSEGEGAAVVDGSEADGAPLGGGAERVRLGAGAPLVQAYGPLSLQSSTCR